MIIDHSSMNILFIRDSWTSSGAFFAKRAHKSKVFRSNPIKGEVGTQMGHRYGVCLFEQSTSKSGARANSYTAKFSYA